MSQQFLYKFTKEIILVATRKKREKELERLEEERRLARIKLEKLRKKFEKYGEKKPAPIIPPPAIPKPVKKPEPVIVQEKLIEKPKPVVIQPKPVIAPAPKPMPNEINFGRILPLVRDPRISYIECQGEGKNIIIKRDNNTIVTQIKLSQSEIKNIIKSFSEKAKIPLLEGMLNARADNLEISAVVSDVVSPSFILKKMMVAPMNPPMISPIKPSKGMLQKMPVPQYSSQAQNPQTKS